jgi:hypothetical protein
LPPGSSATANGDTPPTGIGTGEPPAGTPSSDEPSPTTATWSTGSERASTTSSASATTNSHRTEDLGAIAQAQHARITHLKAKGGQVSLEEAHEIDQAEKYEATNLKADLEGQLHKNGSLSADQARDLAKAHATLARPAPRDRGPLPTVPDARRTIQDLSGKAASGTLTADEAHQHAHAQRAIAQQRVTDLTPAEASGTLTAPQRRQLKRFRETLAASPYGTELPKGPPTGYDPHAANPAHREWHPPYGDKPAHPASDKFTPEALAISDDDIKATSDRLKAQGHAHDRHGPDVTEGQLSDRAMHKVDPITQTKEDGVHQGNNHKSAKHATQFTSERAMTQAVKKVESSAEFADELSKAQAMGKDTFFVKGVSLESALGLNYKEHVRGRTRKGPSSNPTGSRSTILTDGKNLAQYKRYPATGDFHLNTVYPNPILLHEPH